MHISFVIFVPKIDFEILVLITLFSNEGLVKLVQTDQSCCCLHTQNIDVDEDSDQDLEDLFL